MPWVCRLISILQDLQAARQAKAKAEAQTSQIVLQFAVQYPQVVCFQPAHTEDLQLLPSASELKERVAECTAQMAMQGNTLAAQHALAWQPVAILIHLVH